LREGAGSRTLPPLPASGERFRGIRFLLPQLALLVLVAASAPAWADAPSTPDPLYDDVEQAPQSDGFPDPLEKLNRVTFHFNLQVDRWVIDPMVRVYDFVVPAPARRAIRRALVNLDSPVVFANDVLQVEPRDASVTATRFVVNSTVGIGGLFDPAGRYLGLAPHESDFGQTLARIGVPSGPYLMLPIIGPTNVRDGSGNLVDTFFRPTTYLLALGTQYLYTPITEGGSGIATRDAHSDALRVLRESSVDYYAALRNAYAQDRIARIWKGREEMHPATLAARWMLDALSLPAPCDEVRDLVPQAGDESLEALALNQ